MQHKYRTVEDLLKEESFIEIIVSGKMNRTFVTGKPILLITPGKKN